MACARIGTVMDKPDLDVKGLANSNIISISIKKLKSAWKRPFGDLI